MTPMTEKYVGRMESAMLVLRQVTERVVDSGADGIPTIELYSKMLSYMDLQRFYRVLNIMQSSGLITVKYNTIRATEAAKRALAKSTVED